MRGGRDEQDSFHLCRSPCWITGFLRREGEGKHSMIEEWDIQQEEACRPTRPREGNPQAIAADAFTRSCTILR